MGLRCTSRGAQGHRLPHGAPVQAGVPEAEGVSGDLTAARSSPRLSQKRSPDDVGHYAVVLLDIVDERMSLDHVSGGIVCDKQASLPT